MKHLFTCIILIFSGCGCAKDNLKIELFANDGQYIYIQLDDNVLYDGFFQEPDEEHYDEGPLVEFDLNLVGCSNIFVKADDKEARQRICESDEIRYLIITSEKELNLSKVRVGEYHGYP